MTERLATLVVPCGTATYEAVVDLDAILAVLPGQVQVPSPVGPPTIKRAAVLVLAGGATVSIVEPDDGIEGVRRCIRLAYAGERPATKKPLALTTA